MPKIYYTHIYSIYKNEKLGKIIDMNDVDEGEHGGIFWMETL